MLRRPAFFLASLAAFSLCSAAQPDFDFKGLQLGSPISAIDQTKRFICKNNTTTDGDTVCTLRDGQTETIAKEPARRVELFYFERSLVSIAITMKLDAALAVIQALRDRYGPPALSNRNTGNITSSTYTWTSGKSEIVASMIVAPSGSITLVNYRYSFDSPEHERRVQALRNRAAKDL